MCSDSEFISQFLDKRHIYPPRRLGSKLSKTERLRFNVVICEARMYCHRDCVISVDRCPSVCNVCGM